MPVAWKFPNVLPEELPGLALKQEVKFDIELVLGTIPISNTPYIMTLVKLQELKK